MWVRHCGSTRGRLCPNHLETDLQGGQRAATQVCKHLSYIDFCKSFSKCIHKQICILFSQRGLTTCGQFPHCLSRTSLITSVSPYLWVSLSHHHDDRGVPSQCSWLIPVFVFPSFTEWSELCQRWRLLVILRIPFPHWEQLFVRRKISQPHIFPLWLFSDGIIVHFFRDIPPKLYCFHLFMCFH